MRWFQPAVPLFCAHSGPDVRGSVILPTAPPATDSTSLIDSYCLERDMCCLVFQGKLSPWSSRLVSLRCRPAGNSPLPHGCGWTENVPVSDLRTLCPSVAPEIKTCPVPANPDRHWFRRTVRAERDGISNCLLNSKISWRSKTSCIKDRNSNSSREVVLGPDLLTTIVTAPDLPAYFLGEKHSSGY